MFYYVLACWGLTFSFTATMADRVYRSDSPTRIRIVNGCYTVANVETCPKEIQGYLPVGSNDVLFIGPRGITIPGQHSSQQVNQLAEPGKGVGVTSQIATEPGNVMLQQPTSQVGSQIAGASFGNLNFQEICNTVMRGGSTVYGSWQVIRIPSTFVHHSNYTREIVYITSGHIVSANMQSGEDLYCYSGGYRPPSL